MVSRHCASRACTCNPVLVNHANTLSQPGMTYMRAESSQIDVWRKVGNSLSWDSLLHYYKKSERFEKPTEAQMSTGASYLPGFHGTDGPLAVSWPTNMVGNNFSSVLNASFKAIGLPWNGDANRGYMRGFNVFPKTHDRELNVREGKSGLTIPLFCSRLTATRCCACLLLSHQDQTQPFCLPQLYCSTYDVVYWWQLISCCCRWCRLCRPVRY